MMTACGYLIAGLYEFAGDGCEGGAGWRVVAGTTACPQIMEFWVCGRHGVLLGMTPDPLSRLRDIHGHRMEEVILRDLGVPGGEDIVLFNYLEQPGEDLAWPLPYQAWPLPPPPGACTRCPECGRPHGTAIEAMACEYRDRRLPRPQWAAS